jgi:replicative DNA helicase
VTDLAADVAAEQGVIGSMILDSTVIADMAAMLRPEDFYRPIHGTLFKTIAAMFGDGLPIDRMTLLSRLIESGDVARIGGAPYIHTLTEYANPVSATWYAKSVADKATDRKIGELGMQASALASQPGETGDKVAMIRQLADDLAEHRETVTGTWAGEEVDEALTAIERMARGETGLIIPTPWADLNRLLGGGFRPGQLVVIAARPGIGKSTALLDIHRCASIRHGIPSAMFSLEMPTPEIMQRLLSAETGVPLAQIRSGDVRNDEFHRMAQRIPAITASRLRLVDAPYASLPFIRAEGRRMASRDGARMLGVDYLQLLATPPGSESRQVAVSDFSRGLKLLARWAELTVIACAQLNRNPEQRRDRRPTLADVRESGAVEQDADIVLLLHDPTGGEPNHERAGEYDMILAKHRGGPTGTVTVTNRMHLAHLADMAIV